ncbi:unnamed protein product [Cuscuta epithymum]|uniref:Uncharacterized protein n=1 Tax=Cuscuta epithymum TaxID=186058 RepID=A0AAV0DKB2_9ASTE|nr:unnamed protein product [Cuscuta epithymum]
MSSALFPKFLIMMRPMRIWKVESSRARRRCMSSWLEGPWVNHRRNVKVNKGDVAAAAVAAENEKSPEEVRRRPGGSSWTPHPRTGIYFPAGHEGILDDVPTGAAALTQTHWLRNVDGAVDHKP